MRKFLTVIAVLLGLSLWPAAGAPAHGQTAETAIDVGLIIDNSGSMKDNDPANMRYSAAKLFINLLAQGDQVGVVSMGEEATTKTKLGLTPVSGSSSLADDVFRTPDDYADYTYMGEALDLTAQVMDNAAQYNRQRAVILLTDGLPTYLDEARAAQEAKFAAAVAGFQSERIKVFPIALGNAADINFLKTQLADPTGGLVWKAESAEQLVGVFIQILERLQQGRYVDSYEILGNVDTFLANVHPRQQMDQINFVFPAAGGDVPTIEELRLPNAVTADTSRFARVLDPHWSLWTADPRYTRGFNGEWRVQLQSQRAQVPMIAVIKSELRTQLNEPISSVDGDDAAVRFFPAGRKLLLRAGVRNRADDYEKRIGLLVQQEHAAGAGMTLEDGGTGSDVLPVDGEYAGLIGEPLAPGQYRIRMQITPSESHLQLQKAYDIVVEPLPTMQVEVEPRGELAAGEEAQITARWTLDGQPATLRDATITAAVRRSDRTITTVELERQADDTWQGRFDPAESGGYDFGVTAHAEWETPDRGLRRYTDYVDVGYQADRQTSIDVAVSGPEGERVGSLRDGVQRTIIVSSQGDEPAELRLRVAGIPGARVYPDRIAVQPGEPASYTVTISAPGELASGEHAARLLVESDPHIALNAAELPISIGISSWFERNWLGLGALLLLALLLLFRRVRHWLADLVSRNVELLRYGGRSWRR